MDDRRNQSGQRFVLLRHEMPPNAERGSHWDLMLENRGVLLTWELPQLPPGPLPASFEQLGILRLPDHRIDYLEYEGPVSNDRGTVQRVDFGHYHLATGHLATGHLATGDLGEFAQVVACGRFYLIELLVSKDIFSTADGLRLDGGKVVSFVECSNNRSECT